MANRRMFSLDIVDSDNFLDMPASSRCLYYDLGMRADDDGFVNPKKVIRLTSATEDDLKILIAKKYVLPFKSGVVVITHWKRNNYIQSDRYTETIFKNEKKQLATDENNFFTLENPECIQNVYKVDTQVRLGKGRLGKNIYTDFSNLLDWWNTKYQTSYRTNPPNKKYFEIFSRWIENGGTIEDIKAAKTLAEHNPRWGKGIGIDSLLRSGKTRDADWVEHFINFEGYRDQAKEFQQEYLKKRSNDHQS